MMMRYWETYRSYISFGSVHRWWAESHRTGLGHYEQLENQRRRAWSQSPSKNQCYVKPATVGFEMTRKYSSAHHAVIQNLEHRRSSPTRRCMILLILGSFLFADMI